MPSTHNNNDPLAAGMNLNPTHLPTMFPLDINNVRNLCHYFNQSFTIISLLVEFHNLTSSEGLVKWSVQDGDDPGKPGGYGGDEGEME